MAISVTCKACQNKLKVADKLAGKAFKCPKCTTVVRVPGGPSPEPVSNARATSAPPQPRSERVAKAKPRPERREEEYDDRDDRDEFEDEGSKPVRDLNVKTDVPEEFQERILEELSRGETLIWVGTPSIRLVFIRALGFAIGGAVFGLIIAAIFLAATKGGLIDFLPVLIGVVFCVGGCLWPFYNVWKAKKTCYAITSRRAIVWAAGWFGTVEMDNYNPAQLTNVSRKNSWVVSGAGDLVFRSVTTITVRTGKHGGVSESTTHYGFLNLEDVRGVEKLLRETLVDRLVDKLTQ